MLQTSFGIAIPRYEIYQQGDIKYDFKTIKIRTSLTRFIPMLNFLKTGLKRVKFHYCYSKQQLKLTLPFILLKKIDLKILKVNYKS